MYDRYYDDIYRYCLRRTGPDLVEDVVSRVFVTAWRRIDDFPEGKKSLYWLYRVAYRTIGHQWRGESRRRNLEAKLRGLGVEPPVPPHDFVVQNEEFRRVLDAVRQLSEVDREVLLLAVWEQLPQAEIAETLQISVGAVKQRMHRAKKNLAKAHKRLESKGMPGLASERGGGL